MADIEVPTCHSTMLNKAHAVCTCLSRILIVDQLYASGRVAAIILKRSIENHADGSQSYTGPTSGS